MTQRDLERRHFIAGTGQATENCQALVADASTRRYFRLPEVRPAQLLMDVEPGSPDLSAFIAVSEYLNALGLSAPRVLRSSLANGLALIEDFGEQTYTQLLAKGDDETALYELAVDALVHLHRSQHAIIDLPAYDMAALTGEIELFQHWYVPTTGIQRDLTAFGLRFTGLWQDALASVAQRRETLVLRDYHVDNLMIIPNRTGIASCGLLDFQDALIGSRAYDLMSLCQDARRDLSYGLEEHLIARYLMAMATLPAFNPNQFLSDYWLLAAQRHTKVAGIFERLSQRDGKHTYLRHQPRVLRLLRQALKQAKLQDISELLEQQVPGWSQLSQPLKQTA
ncbi:MAG: phosphotransferase [Pseudomonadota bacterium]